MKLSMKFNVLTKIFFILKNFDIQITFFSLKILFLNLIIK